MFENLSGISKRFQLDRIAAGVIEEHCCLLADLAPKADLRRDAKCDSALLKRICFIVPPIPLQDRSEVADRNVLSIHGIRAGELLAWRKVCGQLMSEEVEVDPTLAASAHPAAQNLGVEAPSAFEIENRNC